MPITSIEKNQQILSMALEQRSPGYQDLVATSNPLFAVLKRKGLWRPYSGPSIRERLRYNKVGGIEWYRGFDFLNPIYQEIFNDAEFTPKQVAAPIVISNEEILNNQGENQLEDVFESYMEAAESDLQDEVERSLHSNGAGFGGKELGGLQLAIPTITNSGTYGNISRADYAIWRTSSFDAHVDFPLIGTQVDATTIRPILNQILISRSRGREGADLLMMSTEHFNAYDASLVAHQRIVREGEGSLASLGFRSYEYVGGGGKQRVEIVLAGGIGNNMPANTTYGIDTSSMKVRYNPSRNFDKLFDKSMMPINQDAIVQYIGFMGELTMFNPLFQWKLYDSNPAA